MTRGFVKKRPDESKIETAQGKSKNDGLIQVSFPASANLVHHLRTFIHGCMEDAGFPCKFADDVELAFDEAVQNIIEHTYNNDASQTVWLALHLKKDRIRLDLKDEGPIFLPKSVPPVDIELYFKKKKKGGLGLQIMKKAMDVVEYSHGPRRGNVVTMIKKL
jgi:serine/threonine-protein kinase RsbW